MTLGDRNTARKAHRDGKGSLGCSGKLGAGDNLARIDASEMHACLLEARVGIEPRVGIEHT